LQSLRIGHAGTPVGSYNGVSKKACDGHWANASRYRRNCARNLCGLAIGDVAQELTRSVRLLNALLSNINYGRAGFDPAAANQLRSADCRYDDVCSSNDVG